MKTNKRIKYVSNPYSHLRSHRIATPKVFSPLAFLLPLIVLTLVLNGCYRTPALDTGTLMGEVTEGWPGQPSSLRLEAVTLSSFSTAVLAEVPIGADGRFSVTLPTQADVADALTPAEEICGESLEVSPSSLKVLYAEARVYASTAPDAQQLGVLGYQADSGGALVSVILVYASSVGRVSGSCSSLGLDFDLDLLEGWNQVLYAPGGGRTTLTTGRLPDGLRWRHYPTW